MIYRAQHKMKAWGSLLKKVKKWNKRSENLARYEAFPSLGSHTIVMVQLTVRCQMK
jgi:hypothetical protein